MPDLNPCALLVAHPGHELRVFGWLLRARPICMILTTGSRSGTDRARLQASNRLLATNAYISPLFGAVIDRDFYSAVLAGHVEPFVAWKTAVVDILVNARTRTLVVDGWQMYSVTHDLAHVIGRIAAAEASSLLGHEITVMQYDVVPRSLGAVHPAGSPIVSIDLTSAELNEEGGSAALSGHRARNGRVGRP